MLRISLYFRIQSATSEHPPQPIETYPKNIQESRGTMEQSISSYDLNAMVGVIQDANKKNGDEIRNQLIGATETHYRILPPSLTDTLVLLLTLILTFMLASMTYMVRQQRKEQSARATEARDLQKRFQDDIWNNVRTGNFLERSNP